MSWKDIVRGVAPALAGVLAGPAAAGAVRVIAGELLGDESLTEGQVAEMILGSSPEQLSRLKEIDNAYKLEMKRLGVDILNIGTKDVQNARELAKDDMKPQVCLSIVFIGGFFALLWVMLSGSVPLDEGTRTMVNVMVGVTGSGITMIMRFWFGGSTTDQSSMDRIYNSTPSEGVK